ncbi:MAG: polyribonucleotide nucleotidyltransferase, partial [Chloroflexi bacterium]
AEQAQGAVLVTYGENVVLATVVGAYDVREGTDFLPLTVDYEEKMYAAGKIPGGFIKRESRPSEAAVLTSRLTDRPLRPLFPKGYYYEIQVMVTVLSVDMETDPNVLSIIGSSAALCISDIPFKGPVGAARVGHVNGEFVLNPTYEQLAQSRLDMMIAGNRDAVLMVEAGASELTEDQMLEAVKFGHAGLQSSIEIQEELIREAAVPKRPFEVPVPDTSDMDKLKAILGDRLRIAANNPDKVARESGTEEVRKEAVAAFAADAPEAEKAGAEAKAQKAFASILKAEVRNAILDKGIRPDGRGPTDIRQISVEVGVLPRTHGTGLFTRGQTQVLTICTLGTGDDEQKLDGLGVETKKRYIHHYNFPPFSTGETKPLRSPGRREIGHGMLAERALMAVLPDKEKFPYTIRLVSEILSSNGSTSMAATTGSTLALMDAGVPIKAPVSGIAMGLISDDEGKYAILTDIQGVEDALGDMDFKVTGTRDGVTAIQMDIKVSGLTQEIMAQALQQARDARLIILDKIVQVIPEPRKELSPYAPRITRIQINPDKIGTVIGPGGKMIKKIIEETKATIDIEDDGSVFVASNDNTAAQRAIDMIKALTEEVEVGKTYNGTVKRIMDFGAFVEVLPSKEGLVHISQLASHRVERVEDVVNLGDRLEVKVTGIDSMGRINLSHRAVLEPNGDDGGRDPRGDNRGPRPGGFRDRNEGGFRRGNEGGGRRPEGDRRPGGGGGGGVRREGWNDRERTRE